jgi:uncharacterized protein with PQ loop repeat
MLRVFFEKLLIFCIPFLIYGFITWIFPPTESHAEVQKRKPIILLSCIGLFLVILSLIYTMSVTKRASGVYQPPHLQNGILVPGQFK